MNTNAIFQRREALGLTQEEVARRAQVNRYVITSLESGRLRYPDHRKLQRICEVLDLEITLTPRRSK